VDAVSVDAKDLGVEVPVDLSGAALDPEAHGLVRVRVSIPRTMRGKLTKMVDGLLKKGVTLKIPDGKMQVVTDGAMCVTAQKQPTGDIKKKNVAARLPGGHDVEVKDEWVECECSKEKNCSRLYQGKARDWPSEERKR